MSYDVQEWIHLALRWLHVVAAIYWIGQTALFAWLDARLTIAAKGGDGRVYMVHSGGFYQVERRGVTEIRPRHLQWFKWEAALTWGSGVVLLLLVYYHGGLLVAADSEVSKGVAAAVGLGSMVAGWVVYDLLFSSPLARRPLLARGLGFVLLVALAWGLGEVLSARAAYLHVGAVLGTIMAANVWMRILPGQRRILAQIAAGETPDLGPAAVAKERSRHNTYLALPVVLIMISNHFPVATYGHRLGWLVLAALVLVGFAARHGVERHDARPPSD